jgi:hypothetical protein
MQAQQQQQQQQQPVKLALALLEETSTITSAHLHLVRGLLAAEQESATLANNQYAPVQARIAALWAGHPLHAPTHPASQQARWVGWQLVALATAHAPDPFFRQHVKNWLNAGLSAVTVCSVV